MTTRPPMRRVGGIVYATGDGVSRFGAKLDVSNVGIFLSGGIRNRRAVCVWVLFR